MHNKRSIFRQEAIEHKANNWLGNPRITIPSTALFWVLITMMITIVLAIFLIKGTYSQKVRLSGEIIHEPAVARLEAYCDGTIVRSFVEEGKEVCAGDNIFLINMETKTEYGRTFHEITSSLISQKAGIEREIKLKSEAADKEKEYLIERLDNKKDEIQQLDNIIKKSTEQVTWLSDKAYLFKKFVEKGLALEKDHIERRSEYYNASVQLATFKREMLKQQGESIDIKGKLSLINTELENSREILRRDIARLEQKLFFTEEQREIYVTSPINGKVTGIIGLVGKRISTGQELASIVPMCGQTKIEIFATSEVTGELREGQSVKLRFDAYPYQWFGQYDGIVSSISNASVNGSPAETVKNSPQHKRYFQIHIKPKNDSIPFAGKTLPLRPGIGVEADIFVRKRKIYEWLLPIRRTHTAPLDNTREAI